MLQYQKNASPCVLRTFLNCMAVQSFSFARDIDKYNWVRKVDSQNSDVNSILIHYFSVLQF